MALTPHCACVLTRRCGWPLSFPTRHDNLGAGKGHPELPHELLDVPVVTLVAARHVDGEAALS